MFVGKSSNKHENELESLNLLLLKGDLKWTKY